MATSTFTRLLGSVTMARRRSVLSFLYHRKLGSQPLPAEERPHPRRPFPTDPHPAGVKAKTVAMVLETNEDFLLPYFRSKGFSVKKGLGRRREVVDPVLEAPLFRAPVLNHSSQLPEERKSRVFVINPRQRYSVGDRIRFRVDLYTGNGKPRSFGGDDVRLWLKSADGKSSVAAAVSDLNNGSYVAEALLKWPGVTLVRVSLTYPVEYLRALTEMFHTVHTLRWITDIFDDGKGSQENASRWQQFLVAPAMPALCCDDPDVSLRLIPNNIKIRTEKDPAKPAPAPPPCWSRPPRESWESPAPRGWLNNGTWLQAGCTLPPLTQERVQRCMRNTTVVLLGDSNQQLWWRKITHFFLHCTSVFSHGQWHSPRLCLNSALNSSLLFVSHASPFFVGTHSDLVTVPLPQAFERLRHLSGSHGNAVLVLHYYRHFTTYSVQVYRQRVREARKTVEEYLLLYPKVKVFIRGPHAVYQAYKKLTMIGDSGVSWYGQIWRQEFAGLRDRVWYLDCWDLSLAAENFPAHPSDEVVMEMIKVLFGYMCDV